MKIFNIRNNKEIFSCTTEQIAFLKKHLLKEDEKDDEDFFINQDNIKLLNDKASSDDEKEIVENLKKALDEEKKGDMDIYYE